MKVIIDRFEGKFAVVEMEDGELVNIPRILVNEACEGDIVEILVRKQETKIREEYIKDFAKKLFDD